MPNLKLRVHQAEADHFAPMRCNHQLGPAVDRPEPRAHPGSGKEKRAIRARFEIPPHRGQDLKVWQGRDPDVN